MDAPSTQSPTSLQGIAPSQKWTCAPLKTLADEGTLTVGTKFILSCEGPPVTLKRDLLRFDLPKEQKYALRLLEVKSLSETSGEFIVTTWTPGEVKVERPVLSDGTVAIELSPAQLQISSVVTPETNPEGKPFPPWGAGTLLWPGYLWAFIACLVLAALIALLFAIRHALSRRHFLAQLKKNATALSPYNQFSKDLRRLNKQIPLELSTGLGLGSSTQAQWAQDSAARFFADLNQAFRWYLARELLISAIEGRPKSIAREVRRLEPELYKEIGRDLVIALSELDKAMNVKVKLSVEDAQQLSELCRVLAEKIFKTRNRPAKGRD